MKTNPKSVHVYIGGGAAGYFAAINAAEYNPHIHHILLEATHRPMTKIKISGGGRCNVTHHCFDIRDLVRNYPRGSKELLGAFTRFQPRDTITWFEKRGVELKVEGDGRMFPLTNSSETIISCLNEQIQRLGVDVRKGSKVKKIIKVENHFRITLQNEEELLADKILLATGSFPFSYELASSLGHSIVSPVPSLFTFECTHVLLQDMMGTSFKNVSLQLEVLSDGKNKKFDQKGPLLITHWGLSGPAVLKLSAFAARDLFNAEYEAMLRVNWLGISHEEEVFEKLLSFKDSQKLISSTPLFELSKRFWFHLLTYLFKEKVSAKWLEFSKKDLRLLAKTLCSTEIQIQGKGVFKEEFVTCGGVSLKEVDFKTMESKVCPGLYFAGEILDIDGITGGFNFQNAWTTAWIASQNM